MVARYHWHDYDSERAGVHKKRSYVEYMSHLRSDIAYAKHIALQIKEACIELTRLHDRSFEPEIKNMCASCGVGLCAIGIKCKAIADEIETTARRARYIHGMRFTKREDAKNG